MSGDYAVRKFSGQVRLKAGVNTLEFDGAGPSDSYGLTIENVKLFSAYNNTNLISNGAFSQPALADNTWTYINNGIPSWWAAKAEIGDANHVYNPAWPASSGQCVELDSDSNQRYVQTITITQSVFTSLYVYIQTLIGENQAQCNLASATAAAQIRLNSAVAHIRDDIFCQVGFVNSRFSQYLNQLYTCVGHAVRDLQADQ